MLFDLFRGSIVISGSNFAPPSFATIEAMHRLADTEEVIGFFSYSRDDDEDSRGALSDLRDAIQRELGGLLGRSRRTLRLWQDKEAIVPGKLWEAEIKAATSQAVFFIPIVTPRTLKSGYCSFEFQAFLDRERELGRDDLMFPILYIRVPELETEALWRDRPVLSVIGARQYVNWQNLRQRDIRDREVREAVAAFCATIADALQAPITPAITTRARAEAERRRAIEAARAAEQQAKLEQARAAQAGRLAADEATGAKPAEITVPDLPHQKILEPQERSKRTRDEVSNDATVKKNGRAVAKNGRVQLFLLAIFCAFFSVMSFGAVNSVYREYLDSSDRSFIGHLLMGVLFAFTGIVFGAAAIFAVMTILKKRPA